MSYSLNKVKSESPESIQPGVKTQPQTGSAAAVHSKLFFFFLFLIAVIPLFIHMQWLTGVIVNAVLILTCLLFGFRPALLLAFVPSVAALISGLLPFVLAPVIPFIVSANIILISVFYLLRKQHFIVKLLLAAFLKFLFLYWSAQFLGYYILSEMFIAKVMIMMGWHQFATAIAGGLIAFSVYKGLPKDEKKHNR